MPVARFHTEESFNYLKQITAESANLPSEEPPAPLTSALNDFKAKYQALDKILELSNKNPATDLTVTTDFARDSSWRGSNNYVNAMCDHPTTEVAAYADEVKDIYEKYGDPTGLSQSEESGVLHNLLQDLEALDSSKRTALALDVWINDLKEKAQAFEEAAAQRTQANALRQSGAVKDARAAAEASYRQLVKTINALVIIEGDAEYATFIDHVNAIIDREKSILKRRQAITDKKKGEEGTDSGSDKPKDPKPEEPEEPQEPETPEEPDPEEPEEPTDPDEEEGGTHFEPVE